MGVVGNIGFIGGFFLVKIQQALFLDPSSIKKKIN
jgi:hypothetical protein